jgi:synaptobrevin homolog YKT6
MYHVYVTPDNLSAVLVADNEYPRRVAQLLLTKICNEFIAKISSDELPHGGNKTAFTELPAYLREYKDLMEVDALTKLQGEVDAVKIILNNNVDAQLNRGINLEDLLKRSENVSDQAKHFAKNEKKDECLL